MTQLFVGFWWIKLLGNHLFLSWTIYESIKCYLNEISYLDKSGKKNSVSAWHVKILNVRSHWFKMPGSLPHIFFRIPYQVVKEIQKLFLMETKMKKIIFACHALTHGTHLSWFPHIVLYIERLYQFCFFFTHNFIPPFEMGTLKE